MSTNLWRGSSTLLANATLVIVNGVVIKDRDGVTS